MARPPGSPYLQKPGSHLRTSLVTLVDFFNLSVNYSKDECDLCFQDEQLVQKDKITKDPPPKLDLKYANNNAFYYIFDCFYECSVVIVAGRASFMINRVVKDKAVIPKAQNLVM